ncbi:glycosyltransferase involved in cell wall biosynthesis [Murinocardiopsis flavida]|uniref:Glycosyltransferase involved in cell wall biosynthesis n=1 Tax=Murinocardiopsis flavida TaxID=645275 RepID=A0A2P8DIW3_9ACTN|nr:glycosyltransferase family 4 protein [Murinocardiopsis flavida]PSK97160.1 glycosyltransferase involved in cell wall biosynthesis [Murinocardiopsis flavida]
MVFQQTPLSEQRDSAGPPPPRLAPATDSPTTDNPAVDGPVGADPGPRLDGVRIAVINWRDPWQAAAGGAEEYAWQISRHLVGRGALVTFVTSREPGQARHETRDGVIFRRMGGKFSVYPLVALWLLLWRREFQVALDCMNGIPFFSRLVLPRATRVVSVVHHVHDLQFNAYFNRPMAWFGRFVESRVASFVYRHCTTVTVSESSRRAMREKLGWRGPITVVHNGSPQAEPVPPPGDPSELGAPAVVSLGRLVVQKRVTRVVDLAVDLRDSWPGLRVHVVGRGPESVPLEEQIRRHWLADRVVLHGFLPEDAKNAVLAGSLLHVTASEFEGWGLTVIEAAAMGVPTVAYDVDGLRDSVRDGETGWLVRDGEELSAVVRRALTELRDPARADEVRRACRAWAARFTWKCSGAAMTGLVAAEIGAVPSTGAVSAAAFAPARGPTFDTAPDPSGEGGAPA